MLCMYLNPLKCTFKKEVKTSTSGSDNLLAWKSREESGDHPHHSQGVYTAVRGFVRISVRNDLHHSGGGIVYTAVEIHTAVKVSENKSATSAHDSGSPQHPRVGT